MILVKLEHIWNAKSGIFVIEQPDSNVISSNAEQFWKTVPMLVTVAGIVNFFKEVQSENAPSPIVSSWLFSSISTVVSASHI